MKNEETDAHRLPVREIQVGDEIYTVAGRWERVTALEEASYQTRVHTDRTGPAYAWALRNSDLMEVVRRRPEQPAAVRILSTRVGIHAYIGRPVFGVDSYPLVWAVPQPGRGWQVNHRPAGRDQETTQVADKRAADRLVRQHARAHAQLLGLQLVVRGAW